MSLSVSSLKSLAAFAVVLGFASATHAQERLTSEHVKSIGSKLLDAAGKPADAQIKVDSDVDKGDGIRHENLGAMFLPDRKLTLAAFEAVGAEPVPVGTLWLKELLPSSEGKAIATDKLRAAKLKVGDDDVKVTWYLVGARKVDGKVELVVFGADKKPILTPKLEAAESSDSSEKTPVYLTGEKEDDNAARLHMSVLGKYKTSLTVVRASE